MMLRQAGTRANSRSRLNPSAIASGSQWTSARWWKNVPAASMILSTLLRVARPDSVLAVAQDDWRVTVTLPAEEQSGRVVASLAEAEVEKDARKVLGERVVVGGGDDPG